MFTDRRFLLGAGSGMAAGAFWGLVFLAPELVSSFTPLQLAAARYLAYGAVAAALIWPRWRSLRQALSRTEWTALVWLSLLGNIIYYIFLASAVQMAGIAATTLIIGFLPVVVTTVGSREHGAVPLQALAPSLALAVAGVGLISVEALRSQGPGVDVWEAVFGIACAFGALASWSAYAVSNSRWLSRLPDVSAHDWSLLTGIVTGGLAVVLAVPAFLTGSAMHTGADWLQFWGVSAAVAIGASIIGNAFWNRASRLLPLTMVGQMIIFETLFALLYGFLWEQRFPTVLEAVSCLLLVASVLWCASTHGRQEKAA